MQARTLHTWIARHIAVRTRLAQVGVSYLLFLMVVTRKHSLEEAARFSGLHKSGTGSVGWEPLSFGDLWANWDNAVILSSTQFTLR
jgi:hypothetical protein